MQKFPQIFQPSGALYLGWLGDFQEGSGRSVYFSWRNFCHNFVLGGGKAWGFSNFNYDTTLHTNVAGNSLIIGKHSERYLKGF